MISSNLPSVFGVRNEARNEPHACHVLPEQSLEHSRVENRALASSSSSDLSSCSELLHAPASLQTVSTPCGNAYQRE